MSSQKSKNPKQTGCWLFSLAFFMIWHKLWIWSIVENWHLNPACFKWLFIVEAVFWALLLGSLWMSYVAVITGLLACSSARVISITLLWQQNHFDLCSTVLGFTFASGIWLYICVNLMCYGFSSTLQHLTQYAIWPWSLPLFHICNCCIGFCGEDLWVVFFICLLFFMCV